MNPWRIDRYDVAHLVFILSFFALLLALQQWGG